MQLWRPGGDRTCIVINGLVAIATSNEAFNLCGVGSPALKLKRTKLKKVTKRNWDSGSETPWSDQLWRERRIDPATYSGAI
jgi:hypothetical protein